MDPLATLRQLRVGWKAFLNDLVSGMVMAIVTVPGALANGVLAGINPVYGLYSVIAGTTVAALFTSSVIMNVDSTSATALATGDALAGVAPEQHLVNLVMLGLLVGLFQLLFGWLKLGFLTRFISNAVMTGFLAGIAWLTILGQVSDITGFVGGPRNKVLRTVDTLLHFREIDYPTLVIGLMTIVVIWAIERTRFKRYAYPVALALATVVVAVVGLESVAVVRDSTEIPGSLPALHLPDLSLLPQLIIPAIAIAIIALVQAAGVSQSVPNPDGEYPDPSGDFRGQGAGNVAAGLAGGLPIGGSLSGTALIRSCGGQTRWANVFTGIFAALAVLLLARAIEMLPMAALAALLVMVGIGMIKVRQIRRVWLTGTMPRSMMLVTFLATMALPLQFAILTGVGLHILIYVFNSAERVRIERLVPTAAGGVREAEVPNEVPDREVLVLIPIGSLFFAGAAEFEEDLPDVGDARHAVVVLGLRDREELGSTFIRIIERYAIALQENDCLLMLAGIDDAALEQLERTGVLDLIGRENVFPSQESIGVALKQAVRVAEAWIRRESAARNGDPGATG
jgi:SulP family sulfate permease